MRRHSRHVDAAGDCSRWRRRAERDVFDEQKPEVRVTVRRDSDATNNFALAWLDWQKLAASIVTGGSKNASAVRTHQCGRLLISEQ